MIKIDKILFPTDFSEYADHAREYAAELAKKFGAKVIVVHILVPQEAAAAYEKTLDVSHLHEELQKEAEKRMAEVEAQLTAEGIAVESIIDTGMSFVEIIAIARKHEADLIVMATHGWGAVKHMLLGSTAEKVVRKAPCPVLTIRHPEHEFVHP